MSENYSPYEAYTTATGTVEQPPEKKNGTAAPKLYEINLQVTRERMQTLTIGDFIEFEDNPTSTRAQMHLLSNFVSDGQGNFLERAEAVKEIKQLTYAQLSKSVIELVRLIKGLAVPNE